MFFDGAFEKNITLIFTITKFVLQLPKSRTGLRLILGYG